MPKIAYPPLSLALEALIFTPDSEKVVHVDWAQAPHTPCFTGVLL